MGIVYMLGYENLYYIGSTVQTLKQRITAHESNYKCWLNKNPKYRYCSSFKIIKNEGYEVIEIEEVIGETKKDCKFREQCWIEFYGRENLINKCSASGLDTENKKKTQKKYVEKHSEEIKEWRETHNEEIKQQKKEYYETHKEQIKQQKKEYYETHKEQIKNRTKEYQETHKEQIKQRKKEYREKQKLLLNSNNLNITTTD